MRKRNGNRPNNFYESTGFLNGEKRKKETINGNCIEVENETEKNKTKREIAE